MLTLTVFRLTESPAVPTFGALLLPTGVPFALTLERAWRGNQKGLSCIPRGRYIAKRHNSPKFGETFWLQDVPDRSEILFHAGNIDDDSHGCILVGERFEPVRGEAGIVASREGFAELMRVTAGLAEFVVRVDGRYTF